MVAFRGRLGFRQYLPAKPTMYRIKVWMQADPQNGHANEFQCHLGHYYNYTNYHSIILLALVDADYRSFGLVLAAMAGLGMPEFFGILRSTKGWKTEHLASQERNPFQAGITPCRGWSTMTKTLAGLQAAVNGSGKCTRKNDNAVGNTAAR
ncbi:hypothetical protein BaRGS_00028507 [Batillaria attramentaria]|uniref:Uncharacterized protein n=1 Tax=Batillaria attramentaria TaxID=370345 RepID=A0ABD0JYU8_9CAEN